MPVAPTVSELPLQDIRFLFAGIPQIRMLPDKLKQTGKAGLGEFKLVAHFPASMSNTEADKKAYMARHATFQNGQYGIYYDGTYKLDEIEWDATNRAGVHLVTQDKYGNTVQFPVAPSKSVPGDLKLMISEYVESLVNPPVMIRCSALGGRITPDANNPGTFDLTVNPQQPKCPVKARNHVPAKYHAENVELDHGRYVVDASALTDAEIEYLDFYLYGAETFNSPYAGSGALSDIGLSTDQLTSTWGSGDFDKSSLNSSGHMTVFANAEDEDEEPEYPCDICGKPAKYNFQDTTVRYEIIDDDFENPTVSDYGGQNQNDFYCEVHAKQYEGSDFHTLRSEEGNTPVMPPMEFGEMANWRPLDGTPGLKRNRAENYKHECITCGEGMDELVAKGQTWSCECCGFLVGTQGKHEGCGYNDNGKIMCNLCATEQCDCASFSAEMIECGNCDATFTIDEGLDIGGIDYCEECYDTRMSKEVMEAETLREYSDQGAIEVGAEIVYNWWVEDGPDNLNEWEVDQEVKSQVTYEFDAGDYGRSNQSSFGMPRSWDDDKEVTVEYEWKLVIGNLY